MKLPTNSGRIQCIMSIYCIYHQSVCNALSLFKGRVRKIGQGKGKERSGFCKIGLTLMKLSQPLTLKGSFIYRYFFENYSILSTKFQIIKFMIIIDIFINLSYFKLFIMNRKFYKFQCKILQKNFYRQRKRRVNDKNLREVKGQEN